MLRSGRIRDGLQPRFAYDIILKPDSHDVTTDYGFLQALRLILQCKEKSLIWAGVPCARYLVFKLSLVLVISLSNFINRSAIA